LLKQKLRGHPERGASLFGGNMKDAKITSQKALRSGSLDNGQQYEIYEEFGLYTVYVNGKMKSTHETLAKAIGKIKYLNESNKDLDRARNHGNYNMRPTQNSERRF